MPTVINNPTSEGSGMGVGLILGIVIAIVIAAALFYVYGMPALQGNQQKNGTMDINVQIPDLNNNDNGGGDQNPTP